MLTLIGTPPNLVVAEAWEDFFRASAHILHLPSSRGNMPCGRHAASHSTEQISGSEEKKRQRRPSSRSLTDIVEEYGLNADLYRASVGQESPICGKTLASLHLRREYGIEILEVRTDALVMPAGQYAFMDYIK